MQKYFPLIGLTTLLLVSCAKGPPATDVVYTNPPEQTASSAGSLPSSLRIDVPFSPQAPFAVWDLLHEEACEEMSLIMAQHYFTKEPFSRQIAEDDVQAMIAWQTEQGYAYDTNADEMAKIAREYLKLDAVTETDVTEESIENHLAQGHLVVIPAAGRKLGNPYFSGEGPWYHVYLIVGYDRNNFITHEPGTKRGENYVYAKDVVLSTVHDWTGVKEEIETGRKVMVVIKGKL